MLTRVRIANFRCFEQTEIRDLKRVNLVVGPNGSGKTALLEALFFAMGNGPEIALRLRTFRGFGGAAPLLVSRLGVARLWEDVFYELDRKRALEIEVEDDVSGTRRVKVSEGTQFARTVPLEGGAPQIVGVPIVFEWHTPQGDFTIRPEVTDGGLRLREETPVPMPGFSVAAHRVVDPEEDARRLSELSKRDETAALLRALQRMFPEVRDISVETESGAWAPYLKLGNGLPKIPALFHSAGAARYLSYLLAIAAERASTVLIDELDNGLYYATLERAWHGLVELAEARGTQLFVTTHSRECIEAAVPLLEEHAEAFNVIRMTGGGGTPVRAETVDTQAFVAAIEQGYEVR